MRADEAMISYLDAYNRKEAIINNPLSMEGVIDAEGAKITGPVPIERLTQYFLIIDKVEREFHDQLAILDAQMAAAAPDILAYFVGKDSGTYFIFRSTEQRLYVEHETIVIAPLNLA